MKRKVIFFISGVFCGVLVLLLFFSLFFEWIYQNKIYPNVYLENIPLGGKTKTEIASYFSSRNKDFENLVFTFEYSVKNAEPKIATISAKDLKVGYNGQLLAEQAYLLGRSGNLGTKIFQKLNKISLSPSFSYDEIQLKKLLDSLAREIDIAPVEALFEFSAQGGNNKIVAFRASQNGQKLNMDKAVADFLKFLSPPRLGKIILTTVTVKPKVSTDKANNLGIKEFLAEGNSTFKGSIFNRVYNIGLGASRLNGLLIAPNEIFSFNNAVGEISDKTGYKQAYVIKEKRTVLDDGGGICQVSTTFFRAALASGLPIIERQAHAYRVGYYEQDRGPGYDATVFAPSVDLKIKNNTGNYLLVQTKINPDSSSLTVQFYGTSDDRQIILSQPKITDQTKPPDDLYQEDSNLPKGEIKQIDFSAWGAKVSFNYLVKKNNQILENQTFYSNYQPWQAIYLRGTKE